MITVVASLSNLAISIYLTRRLGVIGVFLGTIITQLLITLPVSFSLVRNLFIHLAEAKFESTLIEITDLARAACKAPAPNSRRHHFEQSLDLQEQMIGAALVIARDVSLDAIIAWNPARQVGTAIDNSL
jgi:hypothetical protein